VDWLTRDISQRLLLQSDRVWTGMHVWGCRVTEGFGNKKKIPRTKLSSGYGEVMKKLLSSCRTEQPVIPFKPRENKKEEYGEGN
jgi:hypothetical protein